MLIILLDEPGLFVFQSVAEAVREIEPADAELTMRAAFDDGAVPYRANWRRPNRRRRWLFGLASIRQGEYDLVPAGPPDPASLRVLLQDHSAAPHPPEAKAQLEALLSKLRAV